MHSSSDPFDFSEYSGSRDGADATSPESPWPAAGPPAGGAFGAPNDPFTGFGGAVSAPAADVFASHRPAGSTGLAQGRTPLVWVFGAFFVVLFGIGGALLTITGGPVAWAWIGWFLAGPVAAILLAQHMVADNKERTRPTYAASKFLQGTYWVSVGSALVGILLGAWQIADWMGRL